MVQFYIYGRVSMSFNKRMKKKAFAFTADEILVVTSPENVNGRIKSYWAFCSIGSVITRRKLLLYTGFRIPRCLFKTIVRPSQITSRQEMIKVG